MKIRAIVVDDEPSGRLAVREHCAAHADIEVVLELGSGAQAVQRIEELRPDVVFLDIQMKPITGLDIARELVERETPIVVFVTAYDRYAVRAFELNAVDYLLKPFDAERFARMLDRVRSRRGMQLTPAVRAELRTMIQSTLRSLGDRANDDGENRLILEIAGHVHLIAPNDVSYAEANGNYMSLCVRGQRHTVRCTMNDLEKRLAPPRFLRIQRSVLVNTAHIQSIDKWFHGEYVIHMDDAQQFTSGRTYRHRIRGLLLRGHTGEA